jgi:hypothetical protein
VDFLVANEIELGLQRTRAKDGAFAFVLHFGERFFWRFLVGHFNDVAIVEGPATGRRQRTQLTVQVGAEYMKDDLEVVEKISVCSIGRTISSTYR